MWKVAIAALIFVIVAVEWAVISDDNRSASASELHPVRPNCIDAGSEVSRAEGRLALARMGGSPYLAGKVGPVPGQQLEVAAAREALESRRAKLRACIAQPAASDPWLEAP